jgi:hypothetical protein
MAVTSATARVCSMSRTGAGAATGPPLSIFFPREKRRMSPPAGFVPSVLAVGKSIPGLSGHKRAEDARRALHTVHVRAVRV